MKIFKYLRSTTPVSIKKFIIISLLELIVWVITIGLIFYWYDWKMFIMLFFWTWANNWSRDLKIKRK